MTSMRCHDGLAKRYSTHTHAHMETELLAQLDAADIARMDDPNYSCAAATSAEVIDAGLNRYINVLPCTHRG